MSIKTFLALPYYIWCRISMRGEHKTQVAKWYLLGGDNKYLVNHKLCLTSTVIDVGGYLGVFSDKVTSRYNPYVYIFEPLPEYARILKTKYKENMKVTVIPKALGVKTESTFIYKSGETSSLIANKTERLEGSKEKIEILDITEALKDYGIEKIDLLSMNIEGAEYDLLEAMLERDIVSKISILQIQFHTNVPDFELRRKNIIKNVLLTHKIRYTFPYVWECFYKC